ncbi:MAG TPA: tetratricopeptide repeat protein [Thermoleophilaceae bacterium]
MALRAGPRTYPNTEAPVRTRTVTVMVAGVEDSARLWEAAPDAMSEAAEALSEAVSEAIGAHCGVRLAAGGGRDTIVAAFQRPADATSAALEAHRAVDAGGWPQDLGRRCRIALHTHTSEWRPGFEDDRFGVVLGRCVRLCAIARGGQTVLSSATRSLVADRLPETAELIDLGVRRLPDLGPPEHVYGLIDRDRGSELGELRSLDVLPNNLPGDLSSFVGRDRELGEVRRALGGTRLLTVTGAGGCGKTRLALQSAADMVDRFSDGAWWVELAPIAEPQLVGQALAAALGVHPLPGQRPLDAAVAHLRDRRALVVLDNCEHLLGAVAEMADALLQGCAEVTIVATSRAPLGLPSETVWRVPSLSLPADSAPDADDALAVSDAARLFVERASRVHPGFAVTDATAPLLAEICEKLDGIPLAIELAAARVRLLSLEQIAAGLSDRFHLLTGGDRSGLSRHRTLRASVDWSHELLSDEERTLFRRLAVFAGGFSLDALEPVGAIDPAERSGALDVLASLVDKSLVVAEQDGAAVRYRMLETVREFALERLADGGELDAIRRRHAEYFLSRAEAAAPELMTARAGERLPDLDADAANLAAALAWTSAAEPEWALRLCAALTFWWKARRMFAAADEACARALEAAGPAPSSLRAQVLWTRGYLLTFAARYPEAIGTLREALETAEAVADRSTVARATGILGMIRGQPDPVGSRPMLERSRELAAEEGDEWCVAGAMNALTWSYLVNDDYDEAERIIEENRPLVERVGWLEYRAWHCTQASWPLMTRAEADALDESAGRAVRLARQAGDPVTECIASSFVARVELAQGRPEQARQRLLASRERAVASGTAMALLWTDMMLGGVRAALGDLAGAREGLERLVTTGADFGWGLSWATLELAEVLLAEGELDGAEERARAALEVAQRIQSPLCTAWGKELLGRVAAGRGRWADAETLLQEALGTRGELGLRLWLPQTLDALAEVASGLGNREDAARVLGAAERARSDLGFVRWPPDRPRLESLEAELRAVLGDERFESARDEGAGLALADAIGWLRRGRGARKRPSNGWESLTPTELEVTRHTAAGLTNPEVGAAMFISRGTVKSHLSRIYAKLGVRNRSELTAEAARFLPPLD